MRPLCTVPTLLLFSCWSPTSAAPTAAVPRRVRIDGQRFVLSATNETLVMVGPNVVVKGPPYLPAVTGDKICRDVHDATCAHAGTCESCTTFNGADADHIKQLGWNTIRLGVVWAGAQPRDENALDPAFLERLHALLNLTDRTGLHVILDNHGDMVGGAGCGNGVPMWVSQKAAPELIGKPLTSAFPFELFDETNVKRAKGYSHCGTNSTKWAAHAGDPNYNLLSECCMALNAHGNSPPIGFSELNQKTMDYVIEGAGQADLVRFWRLVAEAVRTHPSAVAAELMNEPMTLKRGAAYRTWRACAEAIHAVVPDMSVALADIGEGAVIPAEVSRYWQVDIDDETLAWIKASENLFYAWHWYGQPRKDTAIRNAQAIQRDWNVPSFATEFMSCELWSAAQAAGISHSYWHYSSYCTTGPDFGNRSVPLESFGACILGWGGGSTQHC